MWKTYHNVFSELSAVVNHIFDFYRNKKHMTDRTTPAKSFAIRVLY